MKRTKEDYPSFNLFSIVGTWESVNLNPTVIIYRSDKEYLLSIIYVSETTKQASPATYEIQQDGSQYFIAPASKRLYVDYDPAKDILRISSLGDYRGLGDVYKRQIVKHYKPHLNGERFLSNNEVSKKLNVSLRTLQEWRDIGLIPFIQIKGKIIYRQSDIDKLLQKHYFESWKE